LNVLSAIRLFLGSHELPVVNSERDWLDSTQSILASADVWVGDTVVLGIDELARPDTIGPLLVRDDIVSERTHAIWDIYSSVVGARLLSSCRSSAPPHHTQIRWFSMCETDVAQVAVYPQPQSVSGVRMWCDPALILLLVQAGEVQPWWRSSN
jgi:hypothetical protein